MGDNGGEWLRGRGIGRERLAGHLGDFLSSNGYRVERSENDSPPETRITAELQRMNPAVPESGRRIAMRIFPTSGGCAVQWLEPVAVAEVDRARLDRFTRELLQHVERAVTTSSHGTAKVQRPPTGRMPWDAS